MTWIPDRGAGFCDLGDTWRALRFVAMEISWLRSRILVERQHAVSTTRWIVASTPGLRGVQQPFALQETSMKVILAAAPAILLGACASGGMSSLMPSSSTAYW